MFESVWQNIVANAIWTVLIIVAGVVLAWLQRDGSPLILPIFVGLGGGLLVLLIIIAFHYLNSPCMRLTHSGISKAADVEPALRRWLYAYQMTVRKRNLPDTYFSLTVTTNNGRLINVFRHKDEQEQFLHLVGKVSVSPSDEEKINKLSATQQTRLLHELTIELSRLKITNSISFPKQIQVVTRIPIEDLSELKLVERIDDVDFAMQLLISKFRLFLDVEPQ